MLLYRAIRILFVGGLGVLAGCANVNAPTPTPARALSAPTLEASPTVQLRTSEQLYGEAADANTGGLGQNDLTSAAIPSGGSLPPAIGPTRAADGVFGVEVVMSDGARLTGDLYERGLDRVPGVLLVAPDTTQWGVLPLRLHAAGFTVLVMNMRAEPLPDDVDTLLVSVSEIGTVDPLRVALIASEEYGVVALAGCAQSLVCQAAVLFSPNDRDALLNALTALQPRPVLVAVGQDDPVAYPAAVALVSAATGDSRLLSVATGRGTVLLAQYPALLDDVVNWLRTLFVPAA